jgi:uncharacterized membrane protein YkoI
MLKMSLTHRNQIRRPRTLPTEALCAITALLVLLAGCGRDDPLNEPAEPYQAVEIDYERAIRLSAAEVRGSKVVSLELVRPESDEPVWESQVVTPEGDVRTVRLDATRGNVLANSSAPAVAEPDRLSQLLSEARLLPDEAVREATDSTDGPVTAIHLDERDGAPVWIVDALSDGESPMVRHLVDAKTGEVLDRVHI